MYLVELNELPYQIELMFNQNRWANNCTVTPLFYIYCYGAFLIMWKLNKLHWFAIALIYIAFFALIGVAIYLTNSASPLWGLLLMPGFSSENKTDKTKDSN